MKQQYDYSESQLEFISERKHLISNVKYFTYVLRDMLVLSNKQHDQNPKYVVPLQLDISIGWVIEKKDKQHIYKAFTIKYFEKFKEFYSSDEMIRQLRQLITNRVTFYKIADFYEAQYNLGKGSSAKVIQIRELFGEQGKLAAKAIDKAYLQKSESGKEAFYSEVSILSKLSKLQDAPFIKLHSTFEGDHTYYLILDLMAGRTLAEELEQSRQKKELLSIKVVKQIMIQLLKGVKILHENHVIHRDLKPDNIMFRYLESYDDLVIVDFGLATFTNVLKYSFPKCGTPGYVAPEILNMVDRDFKYDKVSDIFSCGCILHKMLFGENLFPGTTFNEVLKNNKICHITISDNYQVPDEAVDLLQRMLEKNPYQRISAAEALQSKFLKTDLISSPVKPVLNLQLKSTQNIFVPCESDSDEVSSPFQHVKPQIKQDFDDHSDITENLGDEGIKIRHMPQVKKPTFTVNEEVNVSINSFYAKDPLSSFKKIKKGTKITEPIIEYQKPKVEYMQRIDLFSKSKE